MHQVRLIPWLQTLDLVLDAQFPSFQVRNHLILHGWPRHFGVKLVFKISMLLLQRGEMRFESHIRQLLLFDAALRLREHPLRTSGRVPRN